MLSLYSQLNYLPLPTNGTLGLTLNVVQQNFRKKKKCEEFSFCFVVVVCGSWPLLVTEMNVKARPTRGPNKIRCVEYNTDHDPS